MSYWTYLSGVIEVTPAGRSQLEKRYILDNVLRFLPKVTGSEENMEVHVSQRGCYSSTSSSHNEFGEEAKYRGGDGYSGLMESHDNYLLTVYGSFRDRMFDETYREFMKWLCRLSKRVWVKSVLVRVSDYEKSVTIDEDDRFMDMFEYPSWIKESDGEPAWWEFLMWEPMKDCRFPMKLGYKYINDPENDAECERRQAFRDGVGIEIF